MQIMMKALMNPSYFRPSMQLRDTMKTLLGDPARLNSIAFLQTSKALS
jgi:hypothetical protein